MISKKNLLEKFINNLTYAFIAQVTSLISNAIMSLLVAKSLGVVEFAYWQLFVFYGTYVGLFHLGLSDGVYLRSGGCEWKDLDKTTIGSQLKIMNLFHMIMLVLLILLGGWFVNDKQRVAVLIYTGVYLLIANTMYYLGFIFQAVNETKIHSIAIIISKGIFIISILLLCICNVRDFEPFCISFLISHFVGMIFLVYCGRRIVFTKLRMNIKILREIKRNISIGLNLTISSVASNLVLGIGRVLVDLNNALEAFGIISLAVSLTSFILNFLSQVSMVMFPVLRKLRENDLAQFYIHLRVLLSCFLCIAFVLFVPFRVVLENWLPQYKESFEYMAILFPICIFDGKMQMLYNTYFKVLRKEKQMLVVNLITLVVSTLLCSIAIWFIDNLMAIAFAMLFAVFCRSLLSGIYFSRTLKVSFDWTLIYECIISFLFIVSNLMFSNIFVFYTNAFVVSAYVLFNSKKIKNILLLIKRSYSH